MDHSASLSNGTHPTEGGQAAFSALIEIVSMLENDAETDWGKVDIDGLRAHLLDMNNLILDTKVTKTLVDPLNIRFDIRGTGKSVAAIHRMVPAHARFVQQSRGWSITPEINDRGAIITITLKDKGEMRQLNALCFYGFMSLDAHHPAHH